MLGSETDRNEPKGTVVEGTLVPRKVKPRFPSELFEWYEKNGFVKFLKLTGKLPANQGRRRPTLKYAATQDHIARGFNIGVLIPPGCLVLDVDQRNGGMASLIHLLADAYALPTIGDDAPRVDDLIESTFAVRSGGGGLHLYFSLGPEGRPRNSLPSYPGIDLQTNPKASYVVAPYSIHPGTGKPYEPHLDALGDFRPLARLPEQLEPLILMPVSDVAKLTAERSEEARHPLWGIIGPDELRALLDALDPVDYQQYDDWINILSAAHHATGGDPDAAQVFVEWSARDPMYANAAHKAVDRKWDTFHERRGNNSPVATVDTILAAVRKAERASMEILGEFDGGTSPALAMIRDVERKKIAVDLEVMEKDAEEAGGLLAGIEALPTSWRDDDPEALSALITRISEQPDIHWDELCGALSERTDKKLSLAQIRKQVRKVFKEREKLARPAKQETPTNSKLVADIAEMAMNRLGRAAGDFVIASDQPFLYNGKYWRRVDMGVVAHECQSCAEEIVNKDAKGSWPLNRYAKDAVATIANQCFTEANDLYNRRDVPSCCNLDNGTIWLVKDGSFDLRPHKREDHLTTLIPFGYDQAARCPSFDTMLIQAFAHIEKRYSKAELENFIRHFWELIGYIIQPNKDIPVAMFWLGKGHNGKSKLVEIITHLVGEASVLTADSMQLLMSGNTHGTASLEGKLLFVDDDVSSDGRIDDGILKKISQNKILTVNPKNKPTRSIKIHTAALFMMNSETRFADSSRGFVRRIFATYFDTDLSHLFESDLPDKALTEIPGILNRALEGLARLRQRKRFDFPQCALDDRLRFLKRAVPLIGFWEGLKKEPAEGASIQTDDLYSYYKTEMLSSSLRPVDKLKFVSDLAHQYVCIDMDEVSGWRINGLPK